MREIKFRAWDKINKKMLQVIRLDWTSTIVICVDDKENIYEIHRSNLELLQFTGLKDKNGKEIYEGDIYKYGEEIGVFESIEDFYYAELIQYRVEKGEIIGNIYENPELLEVNK